MIIISDCENILIRGTKLVNDFVDVKLIILKIDNYVNHLYNISHFLYVNFYFRFSWNPEEYGDEHLL